MHMWIDKYVMGYAPCEITEPYKSYIGKSTSYETIFLCKTCFISDNYELKTFLLSKFV